MYQVKIIVHIQKKAKTDIKKVYKLLFTTNGQSKSSIEKTITMF